MIDFLQMFIADFFIVVGFTTCCIGAVIIYDFKRTKNFEDQRNDS